MSDWVDVGPADVREGELRGVKARGRWVLLSRRGGKLCAIDDVCNHAGCQLSGGWLDGQGAVVCPCHEMAFDVRTGKLCGEVALCDDQERFEAREESGRALVLLKGR